MTVTTIKRCQSDPDWWYTVEDYNVEYDPEPGSGLTITYFDINRKDGNQLLAVNIEWHVWNAKQRARADILAIAAELKNLS